jgi:ABC-type transport system involved in multi-copper enzyme maturation permease subunit
MLVTVTTQNGESAMSQATPSTRTRAPYQVLALVIGAVYLLIGIVGFFVTGFDGFAEHDHDQTLLGFAINPLHNIVHLLVGLLGVTMWSTPSRARTFGWILAIGYGAAFIYGLFAVNNPDINFLNINAADNWLHILSALAGLAIALWPRRHADTTSPGPRHP